MTASLVLTNKQPAHIDFLQGTSSSSSLQKLLNLTPKSTRDHTNLHNLTFTWHFLLLQYCELKASALHQVKRTDITLICNQMQPYSKKMIQLIIFLEYGCLWLQP